MLPPSISIVNLILTISLLVCLTVFLSSLLFKAFNALIFLLRLLFPLLPLPGCLSYEFTSPFFFITLIIPFDHPRLYSTALPPSIIALCFAHSWGIWMTVSCEAFCLCWPASASSSFSSRLSFFLSVSLSHPPLCNLYHPPPYLLFCHLTSCFPLYSLWFSPSPQSSILLSFCILRLIIKWSSTLVFHYFVSPWNLFQPVFSL